MIGWPAFSRKSDGAGEAFADDGVGVAVAVDVGEGRAEAARRSCREKVDVERLAYKVPPSLRKALSVSPHATDEVEIGVAVESRAKAGEVTGGASDRSNERRMPSAAVKIPASLRSREVSPAWVPTTRSWSRLVEIDEDRIRRAVPTSTGR